MEPDPPPPHRPREVVLVTGLSGAGKASILRILEDLGFETVDNPPLSVLEALVDGAEQEGGAPSLAAGVDARTRDFEAEAVLRLMGRLRQRPAFQGLQQAPDLGLVGRDRGAQVQAALLDLGHLRLESTHLVVLEAHQRLWFLRPPWRPA